MQRAMSPIFIKQQDVSKPRIDNESPHHSLRLSFKENQRHHGLIANPMFPKHKKKEYDRESAQQTNDGRILPRELVSSPLQGEEEAAYRADGEDGAYKIELADFAHDRQVFHSFASQDGGSGFEDETDG
jgi:hypothetical protein